MFDKQYVTRDLFSPAPDIDICHGSYVGVFIKGISAQYYNQLGGVGSGDDVVIELP